jgi:hypothetical protein
MCQVTVVPDGCEQKSCFAWSERPRPVCSVNVSLGLAAVCSAPRSLKPVQTRVVLFSSLPQSFVRVFSSRWLLVIHLLVPRSWPSLNQTGAYCILKAVPICFRPFSKHSSSVLACARSLLGSKRDRGSLYSEFYRGCSWDHELTFR